ncbi:riboflavin synthase alpha chain [Desulfurobacterium pacificum]|uniref:Riboflavin synthase n=1 Tax=Desulfurobacterium pacificum TaxID=240166 RepID=A0ABY1NSR8_9BACT|nr:riboflavin synthase [Desulfurobacterium pacificum]SMP16977.1 riboflavin synthase alpha chain [Desulfurobacterium pacificum]
MFTGLVEEVGKVKSIEKSGSLLKVECEKVIEDAREGDSIAVNGVCLTVIEIGKNFLSFDVSPETLRRSNLSKLKAGSAVNLERALKVGDRLGGHILQGHVDTVVRVVGIRREKGGFYRFTFELPYNFRTLVVEKGSIGIDGISLTVAEVKGNTFSVAVIPHTYENTNLKERKVGDRVNVEFDIIGKYVKAMVEAWR